MKIVKYFLSSLFILIMASSCQKEFADELANLTAKGSLQIGPSNDCLPKTILGVYEVSKALRSDSNKIILSVNVSAVGAYVITTDTLNGFSFRGTGVFRETGVNAVEIVASGTPVASGTNLFKVKFDSTICQVPVTVVAAGSGGLAVFSLASGGTPSNCATAVVNGNYFLSAPVNSTNTVTVSVNVTSVGAYSILASGGGLMFAKSGNFTTTGAQIVILTANGTPTTEGANAISFTQPAVACNFNVNVIGSSTFTYNCASIVANGSYFKSVALTSTNTITVPVNVTAIGSYNITTTSGGMTFAKAGGFSTTGAQTVTLVGTGTPTTDGVNTFTLNPGACNFNVTVIGDATFSYNCAGVTANGSYATGTALTGANNVTVPVNVTAIGSYNITTTMGGMTFSKTGAFTNTGTQSITLIGSGTPTTGGINTFTLNPGGCTFTLNVVGPATFSYGGAPGACTGFSINGTYTTGTVLTSSNTVSVQVNVTATGSYNISTNAGGMTFSKVGIFTTTGIQSLTLVGTGTPNASGTIPFSVGNNGCTFEVVVVQPSGTYKCKIDGVLTNFDNRAKASILDDFYSPPRPYLFLDGYVGPPNGSDVSEFQIFITRNNNGVVAPGTYNELAFTATNGYRIEIDYKKVNTDGSVTIWNTSSNLFSPNPPFTIIITSTSGNRIKGTFSGSLKNTLQGGNLQMQITEGVFDLPVL